MKTLFTRRLATVLLGTLLVGAVPAVAAAATISGTAGLGGATKPGRWTALRVSITTGNETVDAELRVTWGDVRLRRPIGVAPATTKDFDLLLRASDARGAIDVRLVAGDRPVAVTSIPVRVLGSEEPFALCALPDASTIANNICT